MTKLRKRMTGSSKSLYFTLEIWSGDEDERRVGDPSARVEMKSGWTEDEPWTVEVHGPSFGGDVLWAERFYGVMYETVKMAQYWERELNRGKNLPSKEMLELLDRQVQNDREQLRAERKERAALEAENEPDPCGACGDLEAGTNEDGYCDSCERTGFADEHRKYLEEIEADPRNADDADLSPAGYC